MKTGFNSDPVSKSFFPIRIKYTDKLESELVADPKDLIIGKSFTVLETNAR